MLSAAMELATRLGEQRVRTTLEVWPGMFHVWPIFTGHIPEADEAISTAVAFLDREFTRIEDSSSAESDARAELLHPF